MEVGEAARRDCREAGEEECSSAAAGKESHCRMEEASRGKGGFHYKEEFHCDIQEEEFHAHHRIGEEFRDNRWDTAADVVAEAEEDPAVDYTAGEEWEGAWPPYSGSMAVADKLLLLAMAKPSSPLAPAPRLCHSSPPLQPDQSKTPW